MAVCTGCGGAIPDGVNFCPACGKAAEVAAPPVFENSVVGVGATGNDPNDIEDNRVLSVLCYFGMAVVIPLVAKPNSPFVRYHANQGIVMIIVAVMLTVVNIVPILGWIVSGVGFIILIVCAICGIINALKGRMKPMPIIGKYTVLK